jgi:hypothetical protein
MSRSRLLLALLLAGCGPTIEVADSAGSTSHTTMDDSATRTTSGPPPVTTTRPDDTSVGEEGESGFMPDLPGFFCDNPAFGCSEPLDCEIWSCGDPLSQVDENGCMRRDCTDDRDCPSTHVCFRPFDWGVCASSNITCNEGPAGTCECISDPDCGGAWCIPNDDAPPSDGCDDSSPSACEASGCEAVFGRPILASNGSCLCELQTPQCIWMSAETTVSPGNKAYMRQSDLEVVAFPWSASPAPLGWTACEDLDFPPPACICAENLSCASG